jgi:hypothetical protein
MMKRRSFLASLLALMPFAKLAHGAEASVKNIPDNLRKFPEHEDFGNEHIWRCIVLGDWGTGSAFQKAVATGMISYASNWPIDAIISTGDNIYPSGVDSAKDSQWKTKFEQIYDHPSLQKRWYSILGNHDHKGDIKAQSEYMKHNSLWYLPAPYFSFTTEFADFFALDTTPLKKEKKTDQIEWLRAQIQNSKANWKIVIGHHMLYSYGAYGDQQEMIQLLRPVLNQGPIDLYMCGHDHDIQVIRKQNDSFLHLTSGAGGGARDTAYGADSYYAGTNGGFAALTISQNKLYLQCMNMQGKLCFAHTLTKKK